MEYRNASISSAKYPSSRITCQTNHTYLRQFQKVDVGLTIRCSMNWTKLQVSDIELTEVSLFVHAICPSADPLCRQFESAGE